MKEDQTIVTENGDIITPKLKNEIRRYMAISMMSTNNISDNWKETMDAYKDQMPVMLEISEIKTQEEARKIFKKFIDKSE